MLTERTRSDAFTEFTRTAEPRLRHALCAAFGPDAGQGATSESLLFAWELWDRVASKPNPVGYLWGVGRTKARRTLRRRRPALPTPERLGVPWVEPALPGALARLTERQRAVVMLVHGLQWTLSEVADVMGIAKTSAQNHLERGMARLRSDLGVER